MFCGNWWQFDTQRRRLHCCWRLRILAKHIPAIHLVGHIFQVVSDAVGDDDVRQVLEFGQVVDHFGLSSQTITTLPILFACKQLLLVRNC